MEQREARRGEELFDRFACVLARDLGAQQLSLVELDIQVDRREPDGLTPDRLEGRLDARLFLVVTGDVREGGGIEVTLRESD